MNLACADHSVAQRIQASRTDQREARVWGLTARQLHDAYWQSRGVQVVRIGSSTTVDEASLVYLLMGDRQLALFELTRRFVRRFRRSGAVRAAVIEPDHCYAERVVAGADGRLIGVKREYGRDHATAPFVVLTTDESLARAWREAADSNRGWLAVRAMLPIDVDVHANLSGRVFDDTNDRGREEFMRQLTMHWRNPSDVIQHVRTVQPGVLMHETAGMTADAVIAPPVWIGAGVRLDAAQPLIGPACIPDEHHVVGERLLNTWRGRLQTDQSVARRATTWAARSRSKRCFDVVFSLFMLIVMLPILPVIMYLIWREDGRPFLFGHRRQGLGGHDFTCWKFRTMCRDAERQKDELAALNKADGPQFHVVCDPRLLRIGRWLRRFHLDELPQFWNVLMGDMSVVGPRPSPESENQFCPAWRETRLSVRPGITGLWQVRRTRAEGADFQEWIHFDMTYVRRANWKLDLWIIWRTLLKMIIR